MGKIQPRDACDRQSCQCNDQRHAHRSAVSYRQISRCISRHRCYCKGLFVGRACMDCVEHCGISHIHANARSGRRLSCVYNGQSHKYEDPVRGECTRYGRCKGGNARKRDNLNTFHRNIFTCYDPRSRGGRSCTSAAPAVASKPGASAGV